MQAWASNLWSLYQKDDHLCTGQPLHLDSELFSNLPKNLSLQENIQDNVCQNHKELTYPL